MRDESFEGRREEVLDEPEFDTALRVAKDGDDHEERHPLVKQTRRHREHVDVSFLGRRDQVRVSSRSQEWDPDWSRKGVSDDQLLRE